ncbi:MAG: DNA-methyltransferase [Thermoflexales bacterium]
MMPASQLFCADCLAVLSSLPAGSFALIYLDPPFNTASRRVATNGHFDDALGSPTDYIHWMRPRLQAMHRLLSTEGSLFFHCDWRLSHHVRLLLDEVFEVERGEGQFVNEIIWRYGLGAARSSRHLPRKHDTIFWYSRSRNYCFQPLREPPTPAMLNKYRHHDADGRRYMLSYGRRYYLKEGKLLSDVWDIPAISPTARERVGYPTQKPVALLERILALASRPGDWVLDPFCGSGTTLVAAQQLGRRWVGIDINPDAIRLARQRLMDAAT